MKALLKHRTKAEAGRTEQGIAMCRKELTFRIRCSVIFSKPAHAAYDGNVMGGERCVKSGVCNSAGEYHGAE